MIFTREEIEAVLLNQTISGGPDGNCRLFVGKNSRVASLSTTRRASLTKDYITVTAARAVLEALEGPPEPGQLACHRCDNKRCIEPDHLYWGSPTSNAKDRVTRGRSSKWSHPQFTPNDVRLIRGRVADGESVYKIAAENGVDPNSIYQMVKRDTYKYVD
jgi:hypothetical protein